MTTTFTNKDPCAWCKSPLSEEAYLDVGMHQLCFRELEKRLDGQEKQVLGKTPGGKAVLHAKGVDPSAPGNLWSRRSVQEAHPGWAATDHLEAYQHLSQAVETAKGTAGGPPADEAKAGQLHAQAEAHNAVHERLTGKSARTATYEAERKKQADASEARGKALKEKMGGQLGQTASGKPIHGVPEHDAHKDFSPQEHLEAADMHRKEAGSPYAGFDRTDEQHAERAYHHDAADKHAKAGRAKLDASKAAKDAPPPQKGPEAAKGAKPKEAAGPPAAGKVRLALAGGHKDVDAIHTAGHYAVHPHYVDPKSVAVTHGPSGMQVQTFKKENLDQAKRYADHMHATAGDAGASIPFGKPGKEHKGDLDKIGAAHKAFGSKRPS